MTAHRSVGDPADITQIALGMLTRYGSGREGAAWWAHEHSCSYVSNDYMHKFWQSVRKRISELSRVRVG